VNTVHAITRGWDAQNAFVWPDIVTGLILAFRTYMDCATENCAVWTCQLAKCQERVAETDDANCVSAL
jgi:hypothetical protein